MAAEEDKTQRKQTKRILGRIAFVQSVLPAAYSIELEKIIQPKASFLHVDCLLGDCANC